MGKVKITKKEKIVPKNRKEESEEEVRIGLIFDLLTVPYISLINNATISSFLKAILELEVFQVEEEEEDEVLDLAGSDEEGEEGSENEVRREMITVELSID